MSARNDARSFKSARLRGLWLLALLWPLWSPAHEDPELAGYVDVPGGQIWYRLNGRQHLGKATALIAIHGGPGGSHRTMMPFVELASERPVILYDQLDCGNSDRPNRAENWTVQRFVSEIEALRRHLKLSKVILAGHSWGGALAAEYAVAYPGFVSGLILSSPLISTAEWVDDASKLIEGLEPDVREALRRNIAAGTFDSPEYRKAEEAFYDRHMCRADPCPVAQYVQGSRGEFNIGPYLHMWGPSEFHPTGTLKTYDVSRRLREVQVPALVICGEFDEVLPATCRRHGARISKSDVVIVPEAAHATLIEQKDVYLRAVREFLAEHRL